jgi:hypothetical protein
MARPTRRIIGSGVAAWDADTDENFDIVTGAPLPFALYALVGDLPVASSYDECFALVGPVGSAILYKSNGSTWEPYQVSDNVADSTATTASEMATDFNELTTALIAAGIMKAS